MANHQVTSSVTGADPITLSDSSTPKLDKEDKNTYTYTCSISIPEGTDTFDLRITDVHAKNNIRVDGLEVTVEELW